MKKILMLILLVLQMPLFAQTNYYKGKSVITGDGFSYNCKVYGGTYVLSNSQNTHQGYTMTFKDGELNPMPSDEFSSINDVSKVYQAFREVFTPEELASLRNSEDDIMIWFIVNRNGSIFELKYNLFYNDTSAFGISPEKYYQLEQKLKQYITYTIEPFVWKYYKFAAPFIHIEFKDLCE